MEAKKKGKGKIIILLILTVVLAVGTVIGIHFVRQSMNYLTTDNARVTTTLIAINPDIPGTLERFTVSEGSYVTENEILGWVQNGEALRSPVDGLVLYTSAVQEQFVSPHEPVAIIADLNNIHIQANIEETDITSLYRGQPVTVTIDTFGNREFNGYISEIGRATNAELSGQALFFNTGGTFTRVTHLIPIEVIITDDVELDNFIGVNARVRIPLRGDDSIPVSGNIPVQSDDSVITSGAVESTQSRNVYSMLDNRIEQINVKVGDIVEAGDILAVLDTGDVDLIIAQHRLELEALQQTLELTAAFQGTQRTLQGQINQSTLQENIRLFDEASKNLENNTNLHILTAQTVFNSAEIAVVIAQTNYGNALNGNTLSITLEEIAILEANHENLKLLYEVGGISRNELQQSEDVLTLARSGFGNASQSNETIIEQLALMLEAAIIARDDAAILLEAAVIAAGQELNMLRSNITIAEITANSGVADIAAELEAIRITSAIQLLEITIQMLEKQLENSTIKTPVSGTVTAVLANEGDFGAGLLFVIEDTDSLRVITSIREYDIARIYEGMEVTITAGGIEHTGIISRISPAAIVGSPVVEFEVEVLITSEKAGLRIGMSTRIEINIGGITQ